jgi:hypothetical protein
VQARVDFFISEETKIKTSFGGEENYRLWGLLCTTVQSNFRTMLNPNNHNNESNTSLN